ncbi:hypothetical protein [Streptomyces sp. E5N91]|uniref:hypothetical protein n=1 Tax=Streptomyces sp. E5N91 TaxID=1851996 RepID=UPI000EF5A1AB|nr:hypothetical protein [Streptomyces sp. E5N91]
MNAAATAGLGEGYVTQSLAASDETGEHLARHGRSLDGAYGVHYAVVVLASEDGRSHITLENITDSHPRTERLVEAVYQNVDGLRADGLEALRTSLRAQSETAASPEARAHAEARLNAVTQVLSLMSMFGRRTAADTVKAQEARALAAIEAILDSESFQEDGRPWRLRLVRPADGESFHDLVVAETSVVNAFTAVVAGAPNRTIDATSPGAVGDGGGADLAQWARSVTQMIPDAPDTRAGRHHREDEPFGIDSLRGIKENLHLWRTLGAIKERRMLDPAGTGDGAAATAFRARTEVIEAEREKAKKRGRSSLSSDFLRRVPTSQLLQSVTARQEWLAELDASLNRAERDDSYSRRVFRLRVGDLHKDLDRIYGELHNRDSAGPRQRDPRTRWIADRTAGTTLPEAVREMWVTVRRLADLIGRTRDGSVDVAPDIGELERHREQAVTALHVLSDLSESGVPWPELHPDVRLELVTAALSSRELRPRLAEAALNRLRNLESRWETTYGFTSPKRAAELLRTLHDRLTSGHMTTVTNVDADVLGELLADPNAPMDALLGRTVRLGPPGSVPFRAVPAPLMSGRLHRTGAEPHAGVAIHWKRGTRRYALHTPVPVLPEGADRPDAVPADFRAGFTLSSLHALVVRGPEDAVRLALAEATDFTHDKTLLRDRSSGRFPSSAHFGAYLPGRLGWSDVDAVVVNHWDGATREKADALMARLREFASAHGVGFRVLAAETAPPLPQTGPYETVHTPITLGEETIGLDYLPVARRSNTALRSLVTDMFYEATPTGQGMAGKAGKPAPWLVHRSGTAPWTSGQNGGRPFFVRADLADVPEHILVQYGNGATGGMAAHLFAARVAADIPAGAGAGPVVLLVSGAGVGYLALSRHLAARTGRHVWAFTRDLETVRDPGGGPVRVVAIGPVEGVQGSWVLSTPHDLRRSVVERVAPDVIVLEGGRVVPDDLLSTTPIPDRRTFRPIGRSAHAPFQVDEAEQRTLRERVGYGVHPGGDSLRAEEKGRLPWTPADGGAGRDMPYFWDSHGSKRTVKVPLSDGRTVEIGPEELGRYLRRRPSLGSARVVLVSCRTGAENEDAPEYAQAVADTLGRAVFAANTPVNGSLDLVETEGVKDPRWLRFSPRPAAGSAGPPASSTATPSGGIPSAQDSQLPARPHADDPRTPEASDGATPNDGRPDNAGSDPQAHGPARHAGPVVASRGDEPSDRFVTTSDPVVRGRARASGRTDPDGARPVAQPPSAQGSVHGLDPEVPLPSGGRPDQPVVLSSSPAEGVPRDESVDTSAFFLVGEGSSEAFAEFPLAVREVPHAPDAVADQQYREDAGFVIDPTEGDRRRIDAWRLLNTTARARHQRPDHDGSAGADSFTRTRPIDQGVRKPRLWAADEVTGTFLASPSAHLRQALTSRSADPAEFGGFLHRRAGLDSAAVVLVSCRAATGNGTQPSVAQTVANHTGKEVFAADTKVSGDLNAEPGPDGRQGEWFHFWPATVTGPVASGDVPGEGDQQEADGNGPTPAPRP